MSDVEVDKEELKEIDICDSICSEEESGVFLNSGASHLDGFLPFHRWVSKGRSYSDGNYECSNTASSLSSSLSKCAKGPHGSPDGEIRMENEGGLREACLYHVYSDDDEQRMSRASSIVDCLLVELYDTYSNSFRGVDSSTEASSSDAFLGRSNTGANFLQELQEKHTRRHQMKYLSQKGEHLNLSPNGFYSYILFYCDLLYCYFHNVLEFIFISIYARPCLQFLNVQT